MVHVSGASTQLVDRAAERGDVTFGNQPSRNAILDQFGNAAMPGADDRQATGHCFEDRDRGALLIAIGRRDARRDQQVRAAQRVGDLVLLQPTARSAR